MKIYHRKSGRRTIRDFNRRRYGNPLFRQDQRIRSGSGIDAARIKRAFLAIVGAAAVGTLCWYLFWSGSFRIENVEVNGAASDTENVIRGLVEERMDRRRALFLPQSSIFMFDSEAARADIEDKFYLERLELRKRLPDSLVIEVEEKKTVATLLAGNRFLAIDAAGFVVRELTERESLMMNDLPEGMGAVVTGELGAEAVDVVDLGGRAVDPGEMGRNSNPNPLIVRKDAARDGLSPGDSALTEDALEIILQTYIQLPGVTGSGVKWFSLDPTADSVDVSLKADWSVYLTTLFPFDIQKERLALVLKEKIGERKADLEYVDLRYDERIFFRFRERD